jgi:hypothetical protein
MGADPDPRDKIAIDHSKRAMVLADADGEQIIRSSAFEIIESERQRPEVFPKPPGRF